MPLDSLDVLAHLPEAVLIVSPDHAIVYVNRSAEKLFGYHADELTGLSLDVILPIAARGRHAAEVTGFLAGGVQARYMHQRQAIHGRRRDGEEFPAEATILKSTRDGQPVAVALVRDLSERHRELTTMGKALEAAEMAARSKTMFLANMSHELRTPLNGIMGFAEMIELQMLGPHADPRYREYGERIHQCGQHLLSLIDDVLEFSAIEMGKYNLTVTTIDVAEKVAKCHGMMQPLFERAGIAFHAEVPAGLVLQADARALRQMLLNLLSNAVKFNTKGGMVAVTAERRGNDRLAIVVRDTGAGIPADRLEQIFIPFAAHRDVYSRKIGGTGLGLAITKALVEMHGGSLTLESTLAGDTRIALLFPVSVPAESAAA